jgi:hypothetical protein
VVFGRPKGRRVSYQQWNEANIPPQVVFEILSPSNTQTEMERKLLFYERHGVEEYYLYNPDTHELRGWLRVEGYLEPIEQINGWTSPRLGVRFDCSGTELQIFHPDGRLFLSYAEIADRVDQAEQRADQEQQRADRLAERLRQIGIDPDQV